MVPANHGRTSHVDNERAAESVGVARWAGFSVADIDRRDHVRRHVGQPPVHPGRSPARSESRFEPPRRSGIAASPSHHAIRLAGPDGQRRSIACRQPRHCAETTVVTSRGQVDAIGLVIWRLAQSLHSGAAVLGSTEVLRRVSSSRSPGHSACSVQAAWAGVAAAVVSGARWASHRVRWSDGPWSSRRAMRKRRRSWPWCRTLARRMRRD
jgi:hypothetical protein